ncbi:MAG: PilN domain-containing protein [Patescibacteria group bacterium]|nr:PilN domain-containing protein [Patescibacteria group bacterium]
MNITLNILPPEKKKALRSGLVMAYVQTMTILLFLSALFVSGVLVSARLMMADELKQIEQQASGGAGTDESADIINNIKQVNSYLTTVQMMQTGFVSWSEVLEDIATMMPKNTRLERISLDQGGHIKISGVATTRDEALAFLKNLKEAPYLTDIVSPLSNILQKTQVSFDFDMKFVPEAIR